MITTPGTSFLTFTTTTSMATTTTTTTPTSTTTAVASGLGSIPSVLPPAAPSVVAADTMQWLEFRLEFAFDNLRDRDVDILNQLDEGDDQLTAIILNEMRTLLRKCEEI